MIFPSSQTRVARPTPHRVPRDHLTRRHWWRRVGGLVAWLTWRTSRFSTLSAPGATNDDTLFAPPTLAAYLDRLSAQPGEQVSLHVSTTAERFDLEVARLGQRVETVQTLTNLKGRAHPIPKDASSHGCRWPQTLSWTIPQDWRPGYYELRLRAQVKGSSQPATATATAFLVVRAPGRGRPGVPLLVLATNTYNAYTNWGGYSLYAYNGKDGVQGRRVSFNRPLTSQFATWEWPFVRWAEARGIELDYAVNSDLEFHPELLETTPLFLSVGHDEYWSKPMRDHLEDWLDRGGNAAFFSGNSVCWQVRSEEDGRALVCYKQAFKHDPVFASDDHATLSTLWSHHLVKRPENQLTGVGFQYGGYHRSHGQLMTFPGGYYVHRPDHWLFEGTGVEQGSLIGSKHTVVGYECDGCDFVIDPETALPVPTGRDSTPNTFEILASAPAIWHPDDCEWYDRWDKGRIGAAVLGVYRRATPDGGTVVTAGSTDWSHGLTLDKDGPDPVIERVTLNVFKRLGQRSSD